MVSASIPNVGSSPIKAKDSDDPKVCCDSDIPRVAPLNLDKIGIELGIEYRRRLLNWAPS